MPDCARCNRPLGVQLGRCSDCGACEKCCDCGGAKKGHLMDPIELGLVELDTAIVRRPLQRILDSNA